MTADERRQYVFDLLRPEARTTRPSRRALVADVLLATVLTVAAVFAAASIHSTDYDDGVKPRPVFDLLKLRPDVPATSLPPSLPIAPPLPGLPTPPPHPGLPTRPPLPDVQGTTIPPDVQATPIRPLLPQPSPAATPADASPGPQPILPTPQAGLHHHGSAPPLLLVALTALPLAARRRYPLTAFWAVLAATLATNGGETWITVLTCAIAAYSAVAHSRNRVPAVAALLLAAVLVGAVDQDISVGLPSLPSWLGPYVVLLSAGAVASIVHYWRRSRSRLAELQQDQDDAMRRAIQAERSRIAGELHDVVTHNVSVMVIQAGAARKVMDTRPEQSKQALIAIEAGGRAAMAELRNVMGLLAGQESGHSDGLEPQPGLDQVDALIERVRAAGMSVAATVSPPRGPLPPGVDLAVYRVVQEALTNAMKHAAGAAASVVIDHRGDCLEIEVTDTGGTPTAQARTGDGRGLIGLRERLALYGGTLDAAPRTGGGYQLKARIPWRTA